MKTIGCILLVSGWVLVIAALVLLAGLGQRFAFVLAGLFVDLLGLALLAYSYALHHRVDRASGGGL